MPWHHLMDVAVAIITDNAGRILITRRALDKPHGGLWEFPGGKLEHDEPAEQCLHREIKEEIGLEITLYTKINTIQHTYSSHDVTLFVFIVTGFKGEAKCNESQIDLQWVRLEELDHYTFPLANAKLIKLIKHSDLFRISI